MLFEKNESALSKKAAQNKELNIKNSIKYPKQNL